MRVKILLLTIFFNVFFWSWLAVYKLGVNSLPIQSEDTVPALFLPLAVLKEQTLFLDSYHQTMLDKYPHPDDKSMLLGLTPFYLKKVGDHYLSAFPMVTPLLGVPVYYLAELAKVDFGWENLAILSHLVGATIMSIAVVVFYTLLKDYLQLSLNKSFLLTTVYAFGTVNFALVSQGMWQHGTVQLFLLLSLLFLFRYQKSEHALHLVIFGLMLGIAVLSRPTAALAVIIFALFLSLNNNFGLNKNTVKNLLLMGVGMLPAIIFYFWYNSTFYGGIQNEGYFSQISKNWLGDFPLSFIGVWLSPSKGIFVYSPVLVFGLLGFFIAVKNKTLAYRRFYLLCFVLVFLHTLIISFWKHWFGGWSFGYRMSSDILPFLVLLIVPYLDSETPIKYYKLFLASLVFSIAVQISGLIFFDGVWHAAYDKGYKDTRWLWSIKDSEAVFNLRRVLVKMGRLEKACDTCASEVLN